MSQSIGQGRMHFDWMEPKKQVKTLREAASIALANGNFVPSAERAGEKTLPSAEGAGDKTLPSVEGGGEKTLSTTTGLL